MASIISQPALNTLPTSVTRAGTLMGVQVRGTGSYVPDEVVRNEDLADLGYDADWILQRTGIQQRRRAPDDIATSDMAYEAACRCLQQAGVAAKDVELIIVATMTPDTWMPSTACRVQRRLGAAAGAMDLNAACTGFMYAIVTGMQFVKTGSCRSVLVIGADLMSRIVNPEDRKTFPLFGDGAGAILLGAGAEQQGILSYTLGADGNGGHLLCIPGGGSSEPMSAEVLAAKRQFIYMDGRPVFKWAVRLIADVIVDVLTEAGLAPMDIDLLVLHQANSRIIDAAMDALEIDRSRVFVNLDKYGNTSAGSIPLVLDEAYRQGRIRAGSNIVLCGFGAGLTWGAALLKW